MARAQRRRWWLVAPFVPVLAAVLVLAVGQQWLASKAGNRWLQAQILSLGAPEHGRLDIEGLHTDALRELTVTGVVITDAQGAKLLALDTLRLSWSPVGLLRGALLLDAVEAKGLRGTITLNEDGSVDIAGLWGTSDTPSTAPFRFPFPIHLRALEVSGELLTLRQCVAAAPDALDPTPLCTAWSIRHPHLQASATLEGDGARLGATTLEGEVDGLGETQLRLESGAANPRQVSIGPTSIRIGEQHIGLRGGVRQLDAGGYVDLRMDPLEVHVSTLPPLVVSWVQGLGLKGEVRGRGHLEGLLAEPTLNLELFTGGGPIALRLSVVQATEAWELGVWVPAGERNAPLTLREIAEILPDIAVGGRCDSSGQGFDAALLSARATCSVALGALPGLGVLTGEFSGMIAPGRLDLDRLRIDHPRLRIDASGHRQPETGAVYADVSEFEVDLSLLDDAQALGDALGIGDAVAAALTARPEQPLTGRLGYRGEIDMVGAEVTLDGALSLQDLDAPGLVAVSRLDAPLSLRVGEHATTGLIELRGEGAALDAATLGLPDPGAFSLEGRIHLGERAIAAELSAHTTPEDPQTARELLAFVGEFHPSTGRFLVAELRAAPTTHLSVQSASPLAGRLGANRVDDLAVELGLTGTSSEQTTYNAKISASGSLSEKDADLSVAWSGLRPGLLTGIVDLGEVEGVLEGELRVQGTYEAPVVEGALTIAGLVAPGAFKPVNLTANVRTDAQSAAVDVTVQSGTRKVATLSGRAGVDWQAVAPRRETPVRAELVLFPSNASQWEAVLDGVDLPPMLNSGALTLSGTLNQPKLRLVTAGRLPVGDRADWISPAVIVDVAEGRATIRGELRKNYLRRVVIEGGAEVDLAGTFADLLDGVTLNSQQLLATVKDLSVDIRLNGLPAEEAAAMAGLDTGVRGALGGGVHIGGTLDAPTVAGGFLLSDGRLGGLPLSPAVLGLVPEGDQYTLTASFGFGDGTGLSLDGVLPAPGGVIDTEAPGLDIRVSGPGVPVAALGGLLGGVSEGQGRISVEGWIRGSLSDIEPELTLSAWASEEVSFVLDDLAVRYTDVHLDALLGSDQLEVKQLTLRTERKDRPRRGADALLSPEPDFELTGKVLLDGALNPAGLVGSATLRRMWVSGTWDQVLRLSGSLCGGIGPADPACGRADPVRRAGNRTVDRLDGRLAVDEARITLDERFFVEGADLELDPAIHFVVASEDLPPSGEPELTGFDATLASIPEWLHTAIQLDLRRSTQADVTMPLLSAGDLAESLSRLRIQCVADGQLNIVARTGSLSIAGELQTADGAANVLGRAFTLSGGSLAFTGTDWSEPLLDLKAAHQTSYGEVRVVIGGTPSAPEVDFESDDLVSKEDILTTLLFGRPLSESDGSESDAAVLTSVLASLAQGAINQHQSFVDMLQIDSTGAVRSGWTLGHGASLYTTFDPAGEPTEVNLVGITVAWRMPWALDLEVSTGSSGLSSLGLWRTWRF